MTPFTNNLVKDDVVMHAESKRVGKVAYTPKEGSRMTGVVWHGNNVPQYIDVMKLRFVVDGKPETVAPVEGEPPPLDPPTAGRQRIPMVNHLDPIGALRKEREHVDTEMRGIETRFKDLKTRREKLDQAIAVLST